MKLSFYLDRLIAKGEFRFERLIVKGIDNGAVLNINSPRMAEEEISLFHRDVAAGDDYCNILHEAMLDHLSKRMALPVVRFADGEYAFYGRSLHCSGIP